MPVGMSGAVHACSIQCMLLAPQLLGFFRSIATSSESAQLRLIQLAASSYHREDTSCAFLALHVSPSTSTSNNHRCCWSGYTCASVNRAHLSQQQQQHKHHQKQQQDSDQGQYPPQHQQQPATQQQRTPWLPLASPAAAPAATSAGLQGFQQEATSHQPSAWFTPAPGPAHQNPQQLQHRSAPTAPPAAAGQRLQGTAARLRAGAAAGSRQPARGSPGG